MPSARMSGAIQFQGEIENVLKPERRQMRRGKITMRLTKQEKKQLVIHFQYRKTVIYSIDYPLGSIGKYRILNSMLS
jgi:hypothetical protein